MGESPKKTMSRLQYWLVLESGDGNCLDGYTGCSCKLMVTWYLCPMANITPTWEWAWCHLNRWVWAISVKRQCMSITYVYLGNCSQPGDIGLIMWCPGRQRYQFWITSVQHEEQTALLFIPTALQKRCYAHTILEKCPQAMAVYSPHLKTCS